MLRFSANLEYLYTELPFLDRFEAAARAGFRAVEIHWLGDRDRGAIRERLDATGLALDSINVFCGDFPGGDRGFAAEPGGRDAFRASIREAIGDATRLDVPKMHILVGKRNPAISREAQLACVAVNLAWAAEQLQPAGKMGLIELLNPYDNPGYIVESMGDLIGLLDAVGSPALGCQFDFYHTQRVQGELIATWNRFRDHAGHIQIADNPGRHEPGTGEIDYRSVLRAVEESGWTGLIGLEYKPSTNTAESLGWITKYGYALEGAGAR